MSTPPTPNEVKCLHCGYSGNIEQFWDGKFCSKECRDRHNEAEDAEREEPMIIEWMESLGFEWRNPGDGDSSCYWFSNPPLPTMHFTHEEATFFYGIFKSQRQKLLAEIEGKAPKDVKVIGLDNYASGKNASNAAWHAVLKEMKDASM